MDAKQPLVLVKVTDGYLFDFHTKRKQPDGCGVYDIHLTGFRLLDESFALHLTSQEKKIHHLKRGPTGNNAKRSFVCTSTFKTWILAVANYVRKKQKHIIFSHLKLIQRKELPFLPNPPNVNVQGTSAKLIGQDSPSHGSAPTARNSKYKYVKPSNTSVTPVPHGQSKHTSIYHSPYLATVPANSAKPKNSTSTNVLPISSKQSGETKSHSREQVLSELVTRNPIQSSDQSDDGTLINNDKNINVKSARSQAKATSLPIPSAKSFHRDQQNNKNQSTRLPVDEAKSKSISLPGFTSKWTMAQSVGKLTEVNSSHDNPKKEDANPVQKESGISSEMNMENNSQKDSYTFKYSPISSASSEAEMDDNEESSKSSDSDSDSSSKSSDSSDDDSEDTSNDQISVGIEESPVETEEGYLVTVTISPQTRNDCNLNASPVSEECGVYAGEKELATVTSSAEITKDSNLNPTTEGQPPYVEESKEDIDSINADRNKTAESTETSIPTEDSTPIELGTQKLDLLHMAMDSSGISDLKYDSSYQRNVRDAVNSILDSDKSEDNFPSTNDMNHPQEAIEIPSAMNGSKEGVMYSERHNVHEGSTLESMTSDETSAHGNNSNNKNDMDVEQLITVTKSNEEKKSHDEKHAMGELRKKPTQGDNEIESSHTEMQSPSISVSASAGKDSVTRSVEGNSTDTSAINQVPANHVLQTSQTTEEVKPLDLSCKPSQPKEEVIAQKVKPLTNPKPRTTRRKKLQNYGASNPYGINNVRGKSNKVRPFTYTYYPPPVRRSKVTYQVTRSSPVEKVANKSIASTKKAKSSKVCTQKSDEKKSSARTHYTFNCEGRTVSNMQIDSRCQWAEGFGPHYLQMRKSQVKCKTAKQSIILKYNSDADSVTEEIQTITVDETVNSEESIDVEKSSDNVISTEDSKKTGNTDKANGEESLEGKMSSASESNRKEGSCIASEGQRHEEQEKITENCSLDMSSENIVKKKKTSVITDDDYLENYAKKTMAKRKLGSVKTSEAETNDIDQVPVPYNESLVSKDVVQIPGEGDGTKMSPRASSNLQNFLETCKEPYVLSKRLVSSFPKVFDANKALEPFLCSDPLPGTVEYIFPDDMPIIERLIMSVAIIEQRDILSSIITYVNHGICEEKIKSTARGKFILHNYGKYIYAYIRRYVERKNLAVGLTRSQLLQIKILTTNEVCKLLPDEMTCKDIRLKSTDKLSTAENNSLMEVQNGICDPVNQDKDEDMNEVLSANGVEDTDIQTLLDTSCKWSHLDNITGEDIFKDLDVGVPDEDKDNDVPTINSNPQEAGEEEVLRSELMLEGVFSPQCIMDHLTVDNLHRYINILTRRLTTLQSLLSKKQSAMGIKTAKSTKIFSASKAFLDIFDTSSESDMASGNSLDDIPPVTAEGPDKGSLLGNDKAGTKKNLQKGAVNNTNRVQLGKSSKLKNSASVKPSNSKKTQSGKTKETIESNIAEKPRKDTQNASKSAKMQILHDSQSTEVQERGGGEYQQKRSKASNNLQKGSISVHPKLITEKKTDVLRQGKSKMANVSSGIQSTKIKPGTSRSANRSDVSKTGNKVQSVPLSAKKVQPNPRELITDYMSVNKGKSEQRATGTKWGLKKSDGGSYVTLTEVQKATSKQSREEVSARFVFKAKHSKEEEVTSEEDVSSDNDLDDRNHEHNAQDVSDNLTVEESMKIIKKARMQVAETVIKGKISSEVASNQEIADKYDNIKSAKDEDIEMEIDEEEDIEMQDEEVHIENQNENGQIENPDDEEDIPSENGEEEDDDEECQDSRLEDDEKQEFEEVEDEEDLSEMSLDKSLKILKKTSNNMKDNEDGEKYFSFEEKKNLRQMAGHCAGAYPVRMRKRKDERYSMKLDAKEDRLMGKKSKQSNQKKTRKRGFDQDGDEEIQEELQKNKERKRKLKKAVKRKHNDSSTDGNSDSDSKKAKAHSYAVAPKKRKGKAPIDLDKIHFQWENKVREDPLIDITYTEEESDVEKSDIEVRHTSRGKVHEMSESSLASDAEDLSNSESNRSNKDDDDNHDREGYQSSQVEEDVNNDVRNENNQSEENQEQLDGNAGAKLLKQEIHRQYSGKAKLKKKRVQKPKGCAYDPNYVVPEVVTVDMYGNLRLPQELRDFDYEYDSTSFHRITGWDRIDDFRYMFCLSVEPQVSRSKGGRWIRFAKVMKALGSTKDNQNCSDHYRPIMGHYYRLSKATGEGLQEDPLKRRILEVCSAQKHVSPDICASSDGGITFRKLKKEEVKANKIRDKIYEESRFKSTATKRRHQTRKESTEASFNAANHDGSTSRRIRGRRTQVVDLNPVNDEGSDDVPTFKDPWMRYQQHRDRVYDAKDDRLFELFGRILGEKDKSKD